MTGLADFPADVATLLRGTWVEDDPIVLNGLAKMPLAEVRHIAKKQRRRAVVDAQRVFADDASPAEIRKALLLLWSLADPQTRSTVLSRIAEDGR